jgi:hypothetical protein
MRELIQREMTAARAKIPSFTPFTAFTMSCSPPRYRKCAAAHLRYLGCKQNLGGPVNDPGTGKEKCGGLHPASVDAQGLQQFGTQGDIAVVAALALANANHMR